MLPIVIIGAVLLAGCAAAPSVRETYPEDPPPEDPLSKDPCSVQKEPEILFEMEGASRFRTELERQLKSDLEGMRRINPLFLCGLTRIEVMEGADFNRGLEHPDRVARYWPQERAIQIKSYSTHTLYHEIGHHVHNLGIFAPTVNRFRNFSWRPGHEPGVWIPKGKNDYFFLNEYSQTNLKEDWAESFALATAYPLEAGLLFYFRSGLETPFPVREKLDEIYQAVPYTLPLQPVTLGLGPSRVVGGAEAHSTDGNSLYVLDSKNTWSRIDPADGKAEKIGNGSPAARLRDEPNASAIKVGNFLILHQSDGSLKSGWEGPGTGWVVEDLRRPGQGTQHLPKEPLLGELHEQEGTLRYFTRASRSFTLKRFDPRDHSTQTLRTWSLPEGFTALHATRHPEANEWLVTGIYRGSHKIKVLRLNPESSQTLKPSSPDEGVAIPMEREASLRNPFSIKGPFSFRSTPFISFATTLPREV